MVWSTRADGFHDYFNAQWYEFTGVPSGSTDGAAWQGMFHHDDQERAWSTWQQSVQTGEPYCIEYRLRHHSGRYRWSLGRAAPVRGRDGAIVRWIGTCTDIDDAKQTAEQNRLLSQELGHRIKNLFAVVGSLVHQALRPHPELRHTAQTLQDRIVALGRAHDYVRPRDDSEVDRSLRGMLADLLSPYPAFSEGRLNIAGDDLRLSSDAATPVALAIHELATNAVKHGALAGRSGRVDVVISPATTDVKIIWRETHGNPMVTPGSQGFGTGLIDLSVQRQLGGSIHRDWTSSGLHATIVVPAARLQPRVASLPDEGPGANDVLQ